MEYVHILLKDWHWIWSGWFPNYVWDFNLPQQLLMDKNVGTGIHSNNCVSISEKLMTISFFSAVLSTQSASLYVAILGPVLSFMLCQCCADQCVLLKHLFRCHKHSWKLSRGFLRNIRWFLTPECWNAVLNSGHWLSSTPHLWLHHRPLHLQTWNVICIQFILTAGLVLCVKY